MEVTVDTKISVTVKSSVFGVLKSTKEVTVGIVDVVTATTVKALEGVKDIGAALSAVLVGQHREPLRPRVKLEQT
jgi:hypothetical protein